MGGVSASTPDLGTRPQTDDPSRALPPGVEPGSRLATELALIGPLDEAARAAADERQGRLTKPAGSMGRLETLGTQLAGIAGSCPPPVPEPVVLVVAAGDHGVHAQGVSPWPQQVTVQMVANVAAGGAVVNALARQVRAEVVCLDVGVAGPLLDVPVAPGVRLWQRRIADGTADLALGPALTRSQAVAALETGIAVAGQLVEEGARMLVTGDLGIGNTTVSAALIAAFTGADPAEVTGPGAGSDADMIAHKVAVIRAALQRAGDRGGSPVADPIGILAQVGGLEHAALAGLILGGAARRVPVLLDGVIAVSAALVARALAPAAAAYLVAGHRSSEPGSRAALSALGLTPLLELDLRLGEGSGAVLAVPLVQAAARMLGEVATFESAGVSAPV